MTYLRFVELAHEEGVTDDEEIARLWNDRPMYTGTNVKFEPNNEDAVRQTFKHFRDWLNEGG